MSCTENSTRMPTTEYKRRSEDQHRHRSPTTAYLRRVSRLLEKDDGSNAHPMNDGRLSSCRSREELIGPTSFENVGWISGGSGKVEVRKRGLVGAGANRLFVVTGAAVGMVQFHGPLGERSFADPDGQPCSVDGFWQSLADLLYNANLLECAPSSLRDYLSRPHWINSGYGVDDIPEFLARCEVYLSDAHALEFSASGWEDLHL